MSEEFKLPPEATPEQVAQAHKDFRTKADLEQMLKEVRELTAGKDILGPDGKPVQDAEERRRMIEAKAKEYRAAKVKELGMRMHELSTNSSDFASCLGLLREAHCLTYLAFSEMSTFEGVDDELIGFCNEFLAQAVRQDPNDQLNDLIRRIKRNVMTFLYRKKVHYEKLMKKRKAAFDAAAELHPNHAPVVQLGCLHDMGCDIPLLPFGATKTVFSYPPKGAIGFEPGEAFMGVLSRLRHAGYLPIVLVDEDTDPLELDSATPVLPEKWWTGACASKQSLDDVLNPVLEKHEKVQVLMVPSIDKMIGPEKEKTPKNFQQALLRIVSWCLNNQVVGLIFSEGSPEARPWLGPSITLRTKEEASNVVAGNFVRDEGKPAVDSAGPDRSGQAAEGSGQDKGGSGEQDGKEG